MSKFKAGRGQKLWDERVDYFSFSLNDLVLVDRNCFYATKTHRLRRNWRNLETLLFLRLGEILYYDGKTVRTVATGLSFPNGINISPTMS